MTPRAGDRKLEDKRGSRSGAATSAPMPVPYTAITFFDMFRLLTVALLVLPFCLAPAALIGAVDEVPEVGADMHQSLDELLDLNVRDGLVYYRAVQGIRGKLDRYVGSLNVAPAMYEEWTRDQKVAFWLNAYNAFVLKTVIDSYPIRGASPDYPTNSIRQIPGAFERIPHQAAGRAVTLDQIEKNILPEFRDPRLYLALGRGAVGSGRLRSEAYVGEKLESQLSAQVAEFVSKPRLFQVDQTTTRVNVSPIFGWREAEFVAAYGNATSTGVGATFARRSPIERAIIALALPHLFPMERQFLQKNDFEVKYASFDWRLNDLTGGRVD